MIFRKNKSNERPSGDSQTLRSRVPEHGSSPLARRLRQDDEPDTIDLAAAPGFQAPEAIDEPDTRSADSRPLPSQQSAVITSDPETGKFYVNPGADGQEVRLCGDLVDAPTELRRGDRIRIGRFEVEFRGVAEDS